MDPLQPPIKGTSPASLVPNGRPSTSTLLTTTTSTSGTTDAIVLDNGVQYTPVARLYAKNGNEITLVDVQPVVTATFKTVTRYKDLRYND
uniref:BTB_2 domain-containing protein n=1 Tax=Panagrellus redivivus TaxID=6233 RepID=A0A7E4VM54_PANRE